VCRLQEAVSARSRLSRVQRLCWSVLLRQVPRETLRQAGDAMSFPMCQCGHTLAAHLPLGENPCRPPLPGREDPKKPYACDCKAFVQRMTYGNHTEACAMSVAYQTKRPGQRLPPCDCGLLPPVPSEIEFQDGNERDVWDRFAAAAMSAGAGSEEASKRADAMLLHRRERRFVKVRPCVGVAGDGAGGEGVR
jgi:hypothetical protein